MSNLAANKRIKEYIQGHIDRTGISQNKLAEDAGMDGSNLSRFMKDPNRDITFQSFLGLAQALRLTPMELLLISLGKKLDSKESRVPSETIDAIWHLIETLPIEVQEKILAVAEAEKTKRPNRL